MYTMQGTLQSNKNDLTKQYLPLVRNQAYMLQKKINYNVELDDLIQSGLIGLLDALDKFKNNQGAQFETYAKTRIYGAMIDDLRKMDLVSQEDRALINKIDKVTIQLTDQNGVLPSVEKVINACEISSKKYYDLVILKNATHVLSHDEDEVKFLVESVSDESQNIEAKSINNQLKTLLAKEIDNLPEREQHIMALYYQEELTLKEIAHVLELTEARVSQLHNSIVAKLREKMKTYH